MAGWPRLLARFAGAVCGVYQRLAIPACRRDEPELMDMPGQDRAELAANLRDIRRVNQLLGGTAVVLRHLPRLLAETALTPQPPHPILGEGEPSLAPSPSIGRGWPRSSRVRADRPVTILDLATGSGDIPVAIVRWARQHGRAVSIVASDVSPEMLDLATEEIVGSAEITLARCDARAVPLPDQSIDIVLCSLALHHFVPDGAVRVLTEMNRLARIGFIVNDLRRDRLGYAAAWLTSRLTTRNRLTRNDAPLSVLRAYTPAELEGLLKRAGITNATISTHHWFRMAAVVAKDTSHG